MQVKLGIFIFQNRKSIGKVIVGLLLSTIAIFFFFLSSPQSEDSEDMTVGEFTSELPSFPEIKGTGNFSDEVAQYAVGTAVKYRLLPSVILSQWAYESEWGRSLSAKNDNNFFGITWFEGCPFPKGTARGIGGSEGGWYMKFPNAKTAFSYYGYMVASQSNFNACVGNKDSGACLLTLGRGGYAAAGITEFSPYFQSCMSIITSNNLIERYDSFAINKWKSLTQRPSSGKGKIDILETVLGQTINNGQCYGLTAYYVEKMGGPKLMGSGFSYASRIGTDYDWTKYGWTVILNPKYSELKAGDVINWGQDPNFATTEFGHTGIIKAVGKNNSFTTYEQNAGKGQICAIYERQWMSSITSVVRKK